MEPPVRYAHSTGADGIRPTWPDTHTIRCANECDIKYFLEITVLSFGPKGLTVARRTGLPAAVCVRLRFISMNWRFGLKNIGSVIGYLCSKSENIR
jgi:hypothetical protein